jgi:hypothetical protein
MRNFAIQAMHFTACWILRILDVRMPADAFYGLRPR